MTAAVHYRKDYKPSVYHIRHIRLSFDLREHETLVTNMMEVERDALCNEPLILNGEHQELFSLKLNGEHIDRNNYQWNETSLTLQQLPEEFTLEIVSRIHPESNTSCEGLYKTAGTFCTQCEPNGFRKMTFYLDRPDVMSLFTTKIIADKKRYPVLLSNGNLIEKGEVDAARHYVIWQDPFKKPCYLFALVAGNIAKITDHFKTMTGRIVALEIYAHSKYIQQCEYALQALKTAMQWDEKRFGREYDLDTYMIYTAEDFNMGAMENKGLNIFNSKYVLTHPSLSTDTDYRMTQAVIGHEYFHNWSGNRVTCRDWFQLSLKEGLTVFREAEFTADHYDRTLKRIEDASYMRSSQFSEDRSPMAHPIRPDSYVEMNNFYTVTVYEKGAEVIRMLHTLLGEQKFRQAMDIYFSKHDGQAVTCDDFIAAMAEGGEIDLTLFQNWYSQAGTPVVNATGIFDPLAETYTLNFTQSCPAGRPANATSALFHIPIRLGLTAETGQPLTFEYQGKIQHEIIYSLVEKNKTLVLKNISRTPVPSLFRDFSAPVKLDYPFSDAELKTLAKYDANLFNRWDAKERLTIKILLAAYHNQPCDNAPVIEIFSFGLHQALKYPAYSAELLSLPSFKTLTEELTDLNPTKLIHAHATLFTHISRVLSTEFLICYQACVASEKMNKTLHDNAPLRALKNKCLEYLGEAGLFDLIQQQYFNATNMTDRIAALTVIVNSDQQTLKEEALHHFFVTYQQHPLLIDKWFAVQAASHASDGFENFKKLLHHPAFNRSNPNKIYNLVLGFANNFYHFHREGGEAYQTFSEVLAEVDRINPIVAARLTRCLMNFKQFAMPWQDLMRQELIHLQALPHLSKDVEEIVNKALIG